MTTPLEIEHLTQTYLGLFPDEAVWLGPLAEHSTQHDEGILSRKGLPGHITAAGYVIAHSTGRILLVHHIALDKLVQPGGHVEQGDETTLQTAQREVTEETGLDESMLHYIPLDPEQPLLPFQIDVHDIPANPKKGEPDHQHYDFRYVFTVDDESEVKVDLQESKDFRWTPLNEFATLQPTYGRAVEKLHRLKLLER